MPSMEDGTIDYYAPFGMSTFDFNSLIRRRYLDDLTERLVEEGRVHRPSAEDGLASVEEQAGPAQTPVPAETTMTANAAVGSPVAAVAQIDRQPRPASSVYSRDIDGNSYRSASTLHEFSSRSASFGSLLPPLMSLQNSSESSGSSVAILGSIDPDHRFPADIGNRSVNYGSLLLPLISLQGSGESSSSSSISILRSIEPDGISPAAVEASDRAYSNRDPSTSHPSWDGVASLAPAPLNVPRSGEYGGDSSRSLTNSAKNPAPVEPRTPDRQNTSALPASSTSATDSPSALASQGTSKGSSSRTSLLSPDKSVPSSATSASDIGSACEVSNRDSPPALASQGTSKGSSSKASLSSPTKSVSSSATSASDIGTRRNHPYEVSSKKRHWPHRLLSSVKKTFRSTSAKLTSVTGSDTSQDQEEPGETGYYMSRADFLELQQRIKDQQIALRGLHPDYHHLLAWGSLCRKITSLDFDVAEMVLVASDTTTCMQVPPAQFWGDRAHLKVDVDFLELAYEKHCQEYFRARLSKRVHRRIAWLQHQARYGSVRKIEDWYREVVDVIGWRDEDEEQLPWSWREHGDYL